jgi:hypothetical protein
MAAQYSCESRRMTFLELCQALRQEAGISGNGPSTVAGQSGELKRVIDWVSRSWEEIQLARKNWMWKRAQFQFNTTASDYDYTPADVGIASRFARWDYETLRIYPAASGNVGEVGLPFLDYNAFLRVYLTGPRPTGMPVCYSIGNDLKLLLGPVPDKAYTITGEYWKSNQVLAADADEPEMPDDYHLLIVYWALEKYGLYEAAGEVIARAKQDKRFYLGKLTDNQLPKIELADPLA